MKIQISYLLALASSLSFVIATPLHLEVVAVEDDIPQPTIPEQNTTPNKLTSLFDGGKMRMQCGTTGANCLRIITIDCCPGYRCSEPIGFGTCEKSR